MGDRREDLAATGLDLARHHQDPADLEADERLLRRREDLAGESRTQRCDDRRIRVGAGQRLELDLRHQTYQRFGGQRDGDHQAVYQQRRGGHVPGLDAEVGRLLGVPARGLDVAGQPEVPCQLRHRGHRPPLQRPARPQVHDSSVRGRYGVVHGITRQRVPERPLPGRVLAQQAAAERFGRLPREPLLRQAGDRQQRRVVCRAGEHRRRVQDGAGAGAEPLDAFEHGVADRRRDLDAVQPAPRPTAVAADQVGTVVHQAHRFLHRQWYARGARVQKGRELVRDVLAGQHRRDERGGLTDIQRPRREPDRTSVGGQPGRQPQQRGGRRHLVPSEGQHHTDRLWPPGDEEQQELESRLIGPVDVLQREDRDVEPVEDLDECPEQPVPGGGGVLQRLRCRGQVVGPLREQRPERAGQPAQAQVGNVVDAVAHGVHHRPEGVRHPQLQAGTDQGTPSPPRLGRQELAQQPGLADARLTLDQDDRGGASERRRERVQLVVPADEPRRGQRRDPTAAVSVHSSRHRDVSPQPAPITPAPTLSRCVPSGVAP